MRKSKLNQPPKVNVIPVLDAVFIFIFFLLMSAQFVDLYELHVKKPVIEETSSTISEEAKSKNFKIKVLKDSIYLTQGVDEKVIRTFNWTPGSLKKLELSLYKIKVNNLIEKSIVIRPGSEILYKDVIKVIDIAQKFYSTKDYQGKLFSSIAFEPLE